MGILADKRVIFKHSGVLGILVPCECGLTIREIAEKDVPTGAPYKIVDVSEIPDDRTSRNGWTVDVKYLTDGVGA